MKTRMKWTGKLLWGLVAVLALGLSAHRAEAIPLSDLLSGGSLQVDDKIFSNFTFSVTRPDLDTTTAGLQNVSGPADATGINVAVGAGGDATHQILTFSGGFSAGIGPGGGAGDADYLIGYTVTTTNGLPLIHDIQLSFNGHVQNSLASTNVLEQAFVGANLVGTVAVSTPPDNLGTNTIILAGGPFTTVNVQKDIHLVAAAGGMVSISAINQTISQVSVPEPTSLLLLGAGLGALGIWKRRQSA